MIKNLLFTLSLLVLVTGSFAQCVTNVNFNTWSQGGHPGNGNWSVQSGGSQVYQSVNGNPTFFLSPNNMINVHISGNFRTNDSDNDWMGFVFSYLNPMTGIDTFDCWMFDWKQEPQDGASDGMSVCRIDGIVPPANYQSTFWNHTNDPAFTVIDNNFGSGGWNTGYNHSFDLYLSFTKAIIYVDGVQQFEIDDCFKPGRFGFYNYSQSDCIYSNFQYDLYVDFALQTKGCRGEQVDINFTSPCVYADLSTIQSLVWDFGDGTVITNNNPTYANANTSHVYNNAGLYPVTLTVTDVGGCVKSQTHTIDVKAPITLTPTLTQPLCNGAANGSVGLTTTGGFGPFNYNWNGGAFTGGPVYSGIPAGTYTVSVTDGICSATGQYTINQPTAVTASVSSSNASCGANNGSATINISGGTLPYQGVTWAGQPAVAGGGGSYTTSGLGAGTYIANFQDANGCSALLQYTATISSLPCGYTLSTSSTNQTCAGVNNGTATVTVTGGVAPITITWSNGGNGATITGLAPGNYTYNYSDGNGQTFTGTLTVGAAVPMVANVTTVGVACAGAANGQAIASVTSGGATPFSYAWSGGGTGPVKSGLSPGNVTVTVTDGSSCTVSASGTVGTNAPLAITMQTVYDSCYNAGGGGVTAHVTGGLWPYTYSWSNFKTDSANLNIIAGNYTLTVTDQAGCTATSTAVVNGAPPFSKTRAVQNIACNGASTGSILVTPAGGTAPYNFNWNPTSVTGSNPQNLSAGVYSFTVTDAYGCKLYGTDTLTQPATALTATTTHTNVTCNGANNGSITINVAGGTPPYSFLGNPVPAGTTTIPNLAPNTYAGNLLDANNCSVALSETITEPSAINLTVTTVMDSCYQSGKGSATAQVSGGTTPYTYAWTNNATTAANLNLLAGSYTVTVTDSSGCTTTATATVTEGPQFTFTKQKQDVLCNGASTGSISLTPNGGTQPYNYTWNPAGSNSPNQQNLAAGNYLFTITDSYSCQLTGSETINQPTALTATTSHTDVTCHGANNGTITLNVSGGTSPYSFLGNPVPAGTTTIPNLAPNTYAGNLLDANNCSVALSETIAEPAAISLTVTTVMDSCYQSGKGSATAQVSGGTTPYTYAWTNNATIAANLNLLAGSYTVTVTDSSGCTATATATVTEGAQFTFTKQKQDVLCNGASTGSITLSPNGGTQPYTYTWNPAGSNAPNQQNLVAGNYLFTITDSYSCPLTGSETINEPTALTATTSHTDVTCHGANNGTITLNVSGGTSPYSFLGNPVPAGSTTIPNLAPNTYAGNLVDANNCSVALSETITEPGPQTLTVTATDNPCAGALQGTLSATYTNPTGNVTYNWNPGGVQGANRTNVASGTYTLTATDGNNCSLTGTATINEPPGVVMPVATTDAGCFGGAGSAIAGPSNNHPPYNYTWSGNAGGNSQTVSPPAGTYTVSALGSDGCAETATFTINQPPQLTISETHTDNLCFGDANGSITVTVGGGTPGTGYTYVWTQNVSTTNVASNLVSGSYTVTATDANNCTISLTTQVTEPTQLSVTATFTPVLCYGGNTGTVTAVGNNGTAPYAYMLTPDGVNFTPSATGLFTGQSAGTYTAIVTDDNQCTATTTVTVTEPTALVYTLGATDVSCFGSTDGKLTSTVSGGTPNFTYTFSNGTQNNTGNLTGLAPGSYDVTVTDATGCTFTESAVIAEPPVVEVSITPATGEVKLGEELQIQAFTNQTGNATFSWQPSQGLSCYDCSNPVFTSNHTLTYQVTAVTDSGCTGTSTITLTVIPNYDIFIPNAFTPNGDGENDTWKIFGNLPAVKQMNLMVFNRIGEKVFETNDVNFQWDGTYQGKPAPHGVYVYTGNFVWLNDHSDANFRGSLTILR
jgi:gliding motility-associated-like protein